MATESVDARSERGRAAREGAPRSSHGGWAPAADRPDPVEMIEAQNESRLQWLVPLRHQRMSESPFAFYRGGAAIMAADLAGSPTSGIDAQLGGDAHLSNFGAYASPERHLVFDANDFDETLRGPWEWDVKRLATSFMIASQHLGFSRKGSRDAAIESVAAYRSAMSEFAGMGFIELWYDHVSVHDLQADEYADPAEFAKRLARFERKAQAKTSLQALQKLAVSVGGRYQIRSDAPVLFPLRDVPGKDADALEAAARGAFEVYRETLNDDRRWLLDRYRIVDIGVKVVGVGSVGTRCLIMLLEGRDVGDPLFLQAKEVGPSALEAHLAPSPYENAGQRVVEGQRMVQAQSDLFLGWTEGVGGRQFYIRQLRDWKGSVEIDGGTPNQLKFYARLCGRTLARGHARSGDAVAIDAYAGKSNTLDKAICEFAESYAAQNQADYDEFLAAIEQGRLPSAAAV